MLSAAIIGYGVMGQRRNKILQDRFSDIVKVITIYDTLKDRIPEPLNNGIKNVDIAFVCSPTPDHANIPINSKFVYIEKPIAGSLEETILLTNRFNGKIRMGGNFIKIPFVDKAVDMVLSELERPLVIRAKIGHDGKQWVSGWRSEYYRGCLLDNGIHILEMIVKLFGIAESCVATVSRIKWKSIAAEDYASAIFRWHDGMMLNLQTSWCENDGYCMIEIQYKDYCLLVDMRDTSMGLYKIYGKNKDKIEVIDNGPMHSHESDIGQFLEIIKNGGHFLGYRDRYINEMKMIDAAYSSKGKEILI